MEDIPNITDTPVNVPDEGAIKCPACNTTNPAGSTVCRECEYSLLGDPTPFEPGVILESRYRIDQEVGRGGMGVVYRGTDLTLSREVAIKAMLASRADAGVRGPPIDA